MAAVVDSFVFLLEWPNFLYLLLAGAFGFLIGALPGLGGALGLVLLLPLTIDMSPETAMVVLLGAYGLVGTGGMITSIVINTPGEASNAATTLDGYPLMRAGRGPEALGAGVASSTIGALIGLGVLVALIPLARPLVLSLSYPEYLMLAVLGLSVIAVATDTTVPRALIAAGLGFLVSFVGLDPVIGFERFTFDQLWLWDGMPLAPVLIGLFAAGEMMTLYRDRPVSRMTAVDVPTGTGYAPSSTYWMGIRAVLRRPKVSVLGGFIGSAVGIVPAVGGVVASFLSYGLAKRLSKAPERFGRGSLEGLAAAESANDAKEGGSMVPTVAFGIPGSIGTAIILGALLFHGIPAGPTLMRDNPRIIYVLIVTMVASKVLAPLYVSVVGLGARRLATIPETILVPIVVVTIFAGTLAADLRPVDTVLLLVFAYVGYSFYSYNFSRIAFVIALILGGLVEQSYHQTMLTHGDPLVLLERPISAVLLALVLLILVAVPIAGVVRRRSGAASAASSTTVGSAPDKLPVATGATGSVTAAATPATESGGPRDRLPAESSTIAATDAPTTPDATPVTNGPPRPLAALIFGLFLLLVAGVVTALTFFQLDERAALVPKIIVVPTLLGVVAVVVSNVRDVVRWRRSRHGTETGGAGAAPERPAVRQWVRAAARGEAVLGDAPWPAVREAVLTVWALLLLGLILTIGFVAAVPVALLLYCVVIHRFSLVKSLLLTTATWGALYALFVIALSVPL